jgi:hypothetical protein
MKIKCNHQQLHRQLQVCEANRSAKPISSAKHQKHMTPGLPWAVQGLGPIGLVGGAMPRGEAPCGARARPRSRR